MHDYSKLAYIFSTHFIEIGSYPLKLIHIIINSNYLIIIVKAKRYCECMLLPDNSCYKLSLYTGTIYKELEVDLFRTILNRIPEPMVKPSPFVYKTFDVIIDTITREGAWSDFILITGTVY